MRKVIAPFVLMVTGVVAAASLPRAAPIATDAELRTAASDAPVAMIDFVVPDKESAAEGALAKRFFNQPEEHRYSGMTTADWSAKWQLFSQALVTKAKAQGFDATSLDACLRALNRGRNRQTMLWPVEDQGDSPDEETKAQYEARRKKEKAKYAQRLRERDAHPEQWYNESQAIVPVGAYLARHSGGECWIVVCKWEMIAKDEALSLGHIMVWALDTRSASVVAYVSCD